MHYFDRQKTRDDKRQTSETTLRKKWLAIVRIARSGSYLAYKLIKRTATKTRLIITIVITAKHSVKL